jgi:small subunit ribosomal protein S2
VETAVEERPAATVRDLLDAGLHFGHQTKRWNPKMKPYIFDKRNGIHIVDLSKSLVMLNHALAFVREVAASGESVLFVGTKKQAQQVIKETAESMGQPYVVQRWLGGMLTNVTTIRARVKRLKELRLAETSGELSRMHKKEASRMRHELAKLERNLSGVADMEELPGAMFVVDINREQNAVMEATRLDIPIIAVVDTNCDPDMIDYPIPGNDDAIRAIQLISGEIAAALAAGKQTYEAIAAEQARKRAEEEKARAQATAKAKAEAEARAKTNEGIKANAKAKASRKAGPDDKADPQTKVEPPSGVEKPTPAASAPDAPASTDQEAVGADAAQAPTVEQTATQD